MSPSDKIKAGANSNSGENQNQQCLKSQTMDTKSELPSSSTSDVTTSGTIPSIPLITASLPTLKCSINDQMKTFDPGEENSTERLTSNHCGNSVFLSRNSSSGLIKNNKNYKAGSKINKLADMLAKRSQKVVEVIQSYTENITVASKPDEKLTLNNVSDEISFEKSINNSFVGFDKTAYISKQSDFFRKSRRKSVPNQSCNADPSYVQSTSKSCLDLSELFSVKDSDKPELSNALGDSLIKLQTDESTKRKPVRKSLKNVELTLILPEKKRRFSTRNENFFSNKINGKLSVESPKAEVPGNVCKNADYRNSVKSSVTVANTENKRSLRKSRRLVETSTQTAETEFTTVIKPKIETEEGENSVVQCESSQSEMFTLEKKEERVSSFEGGEEEASAVDSEKKVCKPQGNKLLIKCQYCSRKFLTPEELKAHCVKKHPNRFAHCIKCDKTFSNKEELSTHNKEVHTKKVEEDASRESTAVEMVTITEKKKEDKQEEKPNDKKICKVGANKTDLRIDVSFESTKRSSVSPRNVQKCSPKEVKTEEQLLEMEMLFYSHLSGNIQENLANHLDGKMDQSGSLISTDKLAESTDSPQSKKGSNLLSVVTTSPGTPDQTPRAPSPYKTRSKTPNPLPPTAKKFKKLPNWQQKFWEKYNFPTNYRYEHRFWDKNYLNTEKSAFYLKDLSCLDIKTQLTMRENIKKLENAKLVDEEEKVAENFNIPNYLSLVPRVNTESAGEWKCDSQKGKKPVRKEKENEKQRFKAPESEPAMTKLRRKISSDNSTAKKLDRSNTEGMKMVTRHQSSLDAAKAGAGENPRTRKGSLDLSGSQKLTLKRQFSLDNLQKNVETSPQRICNLDVNTENSSVEGPHLSPSESAEISGEWVRPRSYLCGTCCNKFTNLWELEDHKWVSHPNVWCTHYEFEDEKIEKLFQINDEEGKQVNMDDFSGVKLTDLYKRYLLPHGSLKTAKLVPSTNFPEQCTKCKKNCTNSSEMHKHMLDCGGDTSWFLTMYSSPMTIKRKWRPFGSRRRKQIGRRDLKRNISNTPNLRSYHYQHRIRTKPGDVESIQKMLANLPEKRARRAINFDEIKTRSQATIHSNRLLRKRFKSSFANNLLKLKNLKKQQQLRQGKKEGGSKSTSDTSSENTPTGTPKRRNKLMENMQALKMENSGSNNNSSNNDTSNDLTGCVKKSIRIRRSEASEQPKDQIKAAKNMTKLKQLEKTRKHKGAIVGESNQKGGGGSGSGGVLGIEKPRRKAANIVENATPDAVENIVCGEVSIPEEKFGMKLRRSDCSEEAVLPKNTSTLDVPQRFPTREVAKRHRMKMASEVIIKKEWEKIESGTILRLRKRHTAQEKTDLIKRMKKKYKKPQKVLNLKKESEEKRGSRRSLRLKSLQSSDEAVPVSSPLTETSVIQEENSVSKDLKTRRPFMNVQNSVNNRSKKARVEKNLKVSYMKKESKEANESFEVAVPEIVTPCRRSSRTLSLRNSTSSDEKVDPLPNKTIQNFAEEVTTQNPDNVPLKKSTRNLSRELKLLLEKPNADPPRVKLQRRTTIQRSNSASQDTNISSDLEEMPILAKVEPIRGKGSRKSEEEIPVLMPVMEEHAIAKAEEDCGMVSFQVVKKPRKTSKEITPLKIVKKVSGEFGKSENVTFRLKKSPGRGTDFEETEKEENTKSKKTEETCLLENRKPSMERRCKNSNKKYFLGICLSEIDKGRSEDGREESGSDSEPLITLVNKTEKADTDENKETENDVEKIQESDMNVKVEQNEGESAKQTPIEVTSADVATEIETITPNVEEEKPADGVDPPNEVCSVVVKNKDETVAEDAPNTLKYNAKFKIQNNSCRRRKRSRRKSKLKKLNVTLTLKQPTLKIIEPVTEPEEQSPEQPKSPQNSIVVEETLPEAEEQPSRPERRSRRISKEIKTSSEFVIDDPLILIDELWSDLDSDSEGSRKKSKKGKKKSAKRTAEEKKPLGVNLEELLRNFGENKEASGARHETSSPQPIKIVRKVRKNTITQYSSLSIRETLQNRREKKSYRRLSLKLFRFSKPMKNFGNRGLKLCEAKKVLFEKQESKENQLPDLPFLATEIKENPVQVIQCGSLKPGKHGKKLSKKSEPRCSVNDIQLKISLPLESINNVFNNNHLVELDVEKANQSAEMFDLMGENDSEAVFEKENVAGEEFGEAGEMRNKQKRSDVIDKIFYCELCLTYYYNSSHLRTHLLSNRHKLNETKLQHSHQNLPIDEIKELSEAHLENEVERRLTENISEDSESRAEGNLEEARPALEHSKETQTADIDLTEPEKLNDDTLEMPVLEGPFIENHVPLGVESLETSTQTPPQNSAFGFSQESLKDIQRAIGCTDEEMLILTLLGENTIEIENDILDLDSCKSSQPAITSDAAAEKVAPESEKPNGILKIDLKQRMTSALACLVNKAVFNLLQKYESVAKTSVNPEAVSLLGKLSNLSRRKNILQLNDLLKKQKEGESSYGALYAETEKKEPPVSYKYQCTICGSRFEKASTRECHISRSHKGKAKKAEDVHVTQVQPEEDWNDLWNYDVANEEPMGSSNATQFWCSDCGINFLSPQEVLEHQKVEHQAGTNQLDKFKDAGPLQSSTIGSSDEIFEGKKRKRPKMLSTEELDQQRIIANNELRKLDRRFSSKNKANKIKWGMDALRFTVEKENKDVTMDEPKDINLTEGAKCQGEIKNIDLVPKLNFTRTSNIPEFKVIQKNSLKNRFQKIIDNKLKRKGDRHMQPETEIDDVEAQLMLLPMMVKKKKTRKQKSGAKGKKSEAEKTLDVYDFNESENDNEPILFSHAKKSGMFQGKVKSVRLKEVPSKNKADSTTKDLVPDDYDSEDSLPLSIVKKSKPGEEDDKFEKSFEEGMEKSEEILEQVEYLIEQLENETGSAQTNNTEVKEMEKVESYGRDQADEAVVEKLEETSENATVLDSPKPESLRINLAKKFIEGDKDEDFYGNVENSIDEQLTEPSLSVEPECSQSAFDEEDSMPLVYMSKKTEETQQEEKKCDDNITDVSTTASEDVTLTRAEVAQEDRVSEAIEYPTLMADESLPSTFTDEDINVTKPYETLNGNVIFCRNESMSDFESDVSHFGLIDSSYEKPNITKTVINEITEKEDVVIVCSKGDVQTQENKSRKKSSQRKKKGNSKSGKKKRRLPLVSATIDENNFRKSESGQMNKELIVSKIWNRRKVVDESTDHDEDSQLSSANNNFAEISQNDESQTEIEKEIIVKKIWSRKKLDYENEYSEQKVEELKINKTEISDEVVIKCGPKSPKRRKSRSSTNESSKETIMRKIWSGKCTFQTKAALKTYESDVAVNCLDSDASEGRVKTRKRGRTAGHGSTKRLRLSDDYESDDGKDKNGRDEDENEEVEDEDDDLDSLLEEIEREQLEKAIRSEFLQLRRSEKGNGETMKVDTKQMGLFAETSVKNKKGGGDKRRRKVKRNVRHTRQSLLTRKKFIKKPVRRAAPEEKYPGEKASKAGDGGEESRDEAFVVESTGKNRKHKKHRHKHHHHKHKHKKSRHHVGKHKSKHKSTEGDEYTQRADSFTILEKICQDIPNQIENEAQKRNAELPSKSRLDDNSLVDFLSPFSFEDSTKDCDDRFDEPLNKEAPDDSKGNVYDFVEDISDLSNDDARFRVSA